MPRPAISITRFSISPSASTSYQDVSADGSAPVEPSVVSAVPVWDFGSVYDPSAEGDGEGYLRDAAEEIAEWEEEL